MFIPALKKNASAAAIFFLAAVLCSAGDGKNTVTIRSIKIQIDNSKYVLDSGAEIQQDPQDFIGIETIMSFTNLVPGMEIKEDRLEAEISFFGMRLEASGYFMNPEVYIVPPRLDPSMRTIIVKVRKGMLSRFSGGLAYAYWGQLAVGGRRNRLDLSAGANFNEVSYLDENLYNRNIAAGAGITYANSLFGGNYPAEFHELSVAARIGFRPLPDLLLYVSGMYRFISFSNQDTAALDGIVMHDSYSWLKVSPAVRLDLYSDFGLSAGLSSSLGLIFDSRFAAVFNAGVNITFSAGVLTVSEAVSYSQAFSELPFPEKKSVSSGFCSPLDFAEGMDDSLLSSNSRISLDLLTVVLLGIFPVSFSVFGFFEAAFLSPAGSEFLFDRTFTAFGPGAGIYFESPVFLHLDFSVGWNAAYEYKVNFTVYGG